MDTKKANETLREIQQLNPDYRTPRGPSAFLIVELYENEEETMELTTSIIDPLMPDKGDAKAYLALTPQQRTILEVSNLINTITPGVAAIAKHAPLDENLWEHAEHNLNKLCDYLRQLAIKAAVACLQHKSNFDVNLKAEFSIPTEREE